MSERQSSTNSSNQQLAELSPERRKLLKLAAGAPLLGSAAAGSLALPNLAAAMEAPANAIKHTVALGDFEFSALLAGTRVAEEPQTIFGMNVSAEEFAEASDNHFIPVDKNRFFFNPSVLRAGDDVVLFDTGLNKAGVLAALEAAGFKAGDITVVVITHMHGDHIGGLVDDSGAATFPNARYVTGQQE